MANIGTISARKTARNLICCNDTEDSKGNPVPQCTRNGVWRIIVDGRWFGIAACDDDNHLSEAMRYGRKRAAEMMGW